MFVTLMVPYLSTGLAGYSVNPENSRDARKLARTSWIIKKKKKKRMQGVCVQLIKLIGSFSWRKLWYACFQRFLEKTIDISRYFFIRQENLELLGISDVFRYYILNQI
jgi:biotin synthase-related radical SAM superfamily protein